MNTDPGQALERALHARRSGNALLCYDLATRALTEHPDDTRLVYPAVLALADLGNLDLATELYERHHASMRSPDEDWLALRGRLYKELALHDAGNAADYYDRSARAYEAAFAATQRPFSGVNAASMHLMAGDAVRATALAEKVLLQLNAAREASDSERYYHHVTQAEACIVLDRLADAQTALGAADAFLKCDSAVRARTLRQLRLLLRARSRDDALVRTLLMPAFLHAMPAPAQTSSDCAPLNLAHMRIGALFIVPGVTAEIELAEQVLATGAAVHAVLPGETREVLAVTKARWGSNWEQRLERVLAQVEDQSPITGFVSNEDDRALVYARQVAQGLAQLRARTCAAEMQVLEVERSDTGLACKLAQFADHPAAEPVWTCAPVEQVRAALQRRHAALIFADMTGFSQLHDRDLPSYWNALMPEIASALTRHSPHVLLQSTWGDALYIVLDSAQQAAAAGLSILATLDRARRDLPGGLAQINVRLSIHFGPVYTGWDPVGLGKLYYGSHVSMAARIEPVTPPGSIYVTEALAAQLELEGADAFDLIYAGEIELAKRYGKRRMFHLRSAQKTPPPQRSDTRRGAGEVPQSRELIIGCTGSLLLSQEQICWVRAALQEQILPALMKNFSASNLTLMMGLAPGADLLFVESARDWCVARKVNWRVRTLLPVPPEMLLADWSDKAMSVGREGAETEMRAHWASMSRVLNESATVTKLWTMDAVADIVRLATRGFRQRQYRRLGAQLAQLSDVLIAICDPAVNGEAGGATEVLNWRKDPTRIPTDLRQAEMPANSQRHSLVVLNSVSREVRLEL